MYPHRVFVDTFWVDTGGAGLGRVEDVVALDDDVETLGSAGFADEVGLIVEDGLVDDGVPISR